MWFQSNLITHKVWAQFSIHSQICRNWSWIKKCFKMSANESQIKAAIEEMLAWRRFNNYAPNQNVNWILSSDSGLNRNFFAVQMSSAQKTCHRWIDLYSESYFNQIFLQINFFCWIVYKPFCFSLLPFPLPEKQ